MIASRVTPLADLSKQLVQVRLPHIVLSLADLIFVTL